MEYRGHKKWSVKPSLLGFGCMRYPTKDGKIDEERALKMIDDAYNAGVNYANNRTATQERSFYYQKVVVLN